MRAPLAVRLFAITSEVGGVNHTQVVRVKVPLAVRLFAITSEEEGVNHTQVVRMRVPLAVRLFVCMIAFTGICPRF